jgi:hypothetical protein
LRTKIVFSLLLGLFVAFGVIVARRSRTSHQAPAPPAATAKALGAPVAAGSGAASASASAASSASAPAPDGGPSPLLDRPLRVTTLGWDLAAPGLIANGGLEAGANSDFSAAGIEVRLFAADAMGVIEGALARGGADKDGADIAVVPFCQFVASYERLRALSPEAFFVVGWSRGREALISSKDALPAPGDAKEVKMVGAAGETATFLGLFALDAAGIPVSSVRLLSPTERTDDAVLAAVDRDAAPADAARRHILLTTADASRLVPFVAVAQHGLLEKNGKALTAWARVWLEGTQKLSSDPPAAARQITAAPGAPEPIALLKRLGQIASAGLMDNAKIAGLSGRGALTLDSLFQRTYRLYRAAGLLATPAPEAAPIATAVIASLVRSNPALVTAPPPPRVSPGAAGSAASGKGAPANVEALRALIPFRQADGKLDEPELLSTAAFFADVFERSVLRVSVGRGGAVDANATKRLIDTVTGQFDVAASRLVAAKKLPPKAAAAVDVLAAP